MFEPQSRKLCEAGLLPEPGDDQLISRLLDRISIQEGEILILRQLEETIRRNTHLFEVLLKKSQEGILLVTSEMMLLRLVHPAFGHSDMEIVGQSALVFIHPDDRDLVQQVFSALVSGRTTTG